MKSVFIWERVFKLTKRYHSSGGLVVIADSLEEAIKLAMEHGKWEDFDAYYSEEKLNDESEPEMKYSYPEIGAPDRVIPIADFYGKGKTDEVFIFPNAGCC